MLLSSTQEIYYININAVKLKVITICTLHSNLTRFRTSYWTVQHKISIAIARNSVNSN